MAAIQEREYETEAEYLETMIALKQEELALWQRRKQVHTPIDHTVCTFASICLNGYNTNLF